MTPPRIDANVILRFLTGEPAAQAERAARFLESLARGQDEAQLDEVVLAEVVWTLASYYRMPRADIADALLGLLGLEHLKADAKDILRSALVLYARRNLDLADALVAARALQSDNPVVVSFDRDFDRIPGIIRREP